LEFELLRCCQIAGSRASRNDWSRGAVGAGRRKQQCGKEQQGDQNIGYHHRSLRFLSFQ
jgi:hypothetical protein